MESQDGAFISYKGILQWLNSQETAAPRDIAEGRRRENVIRNQCRTLCRCGLLERVTHDVYTLSEQGQKYVNGELDLPEADGDIAIDRLHQDSQWSQGGCRIKDTRGMDAETIIAFNFDRYENDHYGLVHGSRADTKQRIGNVSESDLDRVIREFPLNQPLIQQCAHWVRAISGLHFFPDANHRTAIGTLRGLLFLNDIIRPDGWPGRELDRTIIKAKFIRNFVVDVRFDNLWQKDELYQIWHRHFRNLFLDIEDTTYHARPTTRLGRALDAARKQG